MSLRVRTPLSCPASPLDVLSIPGNPFRETGPPANMAKLILLRHKVSAVFWRSRTVALTHRRSRQVTGSGAVPPIRAPHHGHSSAPRLERPNRPGCALESRSPESNTIDTRVQLDFPTTVPYPPRLCATT